MAWKDLSYSKKYGIILAAVHIAVFMLLVSFSAIQNVSSPGYQYEPWPAIMVMFIPDAPIFFILDTPIALPLMNIFRSLFGSEFGLNILVFVLGTLQWFIIGAIIGWIVGKIKNKKGVKKK